MQGRLGPYRFIRPLSSGGQGQVYLGYDERLQRRVAIKIRPLPPLREARQSILREARLAARLDSPTIVRVHDAIESDTHLGIVMEFVSGCTLEHLLASIRPSLASVITIGQDLAIALTAARQAGIVHGDIKASNVLLTRDGHAKLADFGISRQLVTQSPEPLHSATPSCMSPESYARHRQDHRSDLFALGILFYRMLSGAHPFYRDGVLDAKMLLGANPTPLSELVGGDPVVIGPLLEMVHGLLRKDPCERVDTTLRVRQVLLDVSRKLPVIEVDTLRRELAPYLCAEPLADVPQGLPGGFDRRARFHYIDAGGWPARAAYWLRRANWWRRGIAISVVAAMLAAPVTAAYYYDATEVRFSTPLVTYEGTPRPPVDLDASWLLDEVKAVLEEELGRLDVRGSVGAGAQRTVYSPTARMLRAQPPDETYTLALRCVDGICVFAVSRNRDDVRSDEQGVLLADMSADEWRGVVRNTTAALFH